MKDRDYTQMEVAEKLSKAVQKKTMARSFVQQSSSFGGRRGGMPVQYVLQATNIEKLQEVLPKFMTKVYENPVFQMADVNLKFSKPEARININRDKASIMGVSTKNIAQTLQYGLSGQRMGYFYMNGKQYEIELTGGIAPRNCTVTTVSCPPPSPRGLPTGRPSGKDWTKWTRLPRRHWTRPSVPH